MSWAIGWAVCVYWARPIRVRVGSILLKSQVNLCIKTEEMYHSDQARSRSKIIRRSLSLLPIPALVARLTPIDEVRQLGVRDVFGGGDGASIKLKRASQVRSKQSRRNLRSSRAASRLAGTGGYGRSKRLGKIGQGF